MVIFNSYVKLPEGKVTFFFSLCSHITRMWPEMSRAVVFSHCHASAIQGYCTVKHGIQLLIMLIPTFWRLLTKYLVIHLFASGNIEIQYIYIYVHVCVCIHICMYIYIYIHSLSSPSAKDTALNQPKHYLALPSAAERAHVRQKPLRPSTKRKHSVAPGSKGSWSLGP